VDPNCKMRFAKIQDVNQHIKKTGCNENQKVTVADYFSIPQMQELISSSIKYLSSKTS